MSRKRLLFGAVVICLVVLNGALFWHSVDASHHHSLQPFDNKKTISEIKSSRKPQSELSIKQESTPPATPAAPVQAAPATPTPTVTKKPAPKPAPASTPKPAAPVSSQPTPVEASTSLAFINNLRTAKGMPPLISNSTLTQWANTHATRLAKECSLYHQHLDTFLTKSIGVVSVYSIAENVGMATSVNKVLSLLQESAPHYANMTGNYTYVGVSVVRATGGSCAGYYYTTQLFAR